MVNDGQGAGESEQTEAQPEGPCKGSNTSPEQFLQAPMSLLLAWLVLSLGTSSKAPPPHLLLSEKPSLYTEYRLPFQPVTRSLLINKAVSGQSSLVIRSLSETQSCRHHPPDPFTYGAINLMLCK